MPTVIKAPITPASDNKPHIVKLKVFWKTTRLWTESDIVDYRNSVLDLTEQIRNEQYWNREGDLRTNRFTCEDFALRVLIQYAASKGLPIKLTNGVRTYRNMEAYDEHEQYDSTMYGYANMVERTFGAPDIQHSNVNTLPLKEADDLQAGDVLALAHDWKGRRSKGAAHHVQLVVSRSARIIDVRQGNSDSSIHRPLTWANKLFGRDPAAPDQSAYAGLPVEIGRYTKAELGWDYRNETSGTHEKDYLKYLEFYSWNFFEFNR